MATKQRRQTDRKDNLNKKYSAHNQKVPNKKNNSSGLSY